MDPPRPYGIRQSEVPGSENSPYRLVLDPPQASYEAARLTLLKYPPARVAPLRLTSRLFPNRPSTLPFPGSSSLPAAIEFPGPR
jgi:hypothetical protein